MSSPLQIDAKISWFIRVHVALILVVISLGCAAENSDISFTREEFDGYEISAGSEGRNTEPDPPSTPSQGGYSGGAEEAGYPYAGTEGEGGNGGMDEPLASENPESCSGYQIQIEEKLECVTLNEEGCYELDQYISECRDQDGDCFWDCSDDDVDGIPPELLDADDRRGYVGSEAEDRSIDDDPPTDLIIGAADSGVPNTRLLPFPTITDPAVCNNGSIVSLHRGQGVWSLSRVHIDHEDTEVMSSLDLGSETRNIWLGCDRDQIYIASLVDGWIKYLTWNDDLINEINLESAMPRGGDVILRDLRLNKSGQLTWLQANQEGWSSYVLNRVLRPSRLSQIPQNVTQLIHESPTQGDDPVSAWVNDEGRLQLSFDTLEEIDQLNTNSYVFGTNRWLAWNSSERTTRVTFFPWMLSQYTDSTGYPDGLEVETINVDFSTFDQLEIVDFVDDKMLVRLEREDTISWGLYELNSQTLRLLPSLDQVSVKAQNIKYDGKLIVWFEPQEDTRQATTLHYMEIQ